MRKSDHQALRDWNKLCESIRKATVVDMHETPHERKQRIKRLEKKPEEWFEYYFPNFYFAEPAPFHKRATKRLLDNPEWYEIRNWSRELAKSTRAMMEVIFLLLTKKKRNMLLISATYDSAEGLMKPYKAQFEANLRIINDYGKQQRFGSWEDGNITTQSGISIRAIGAGQKPRGTKNDEVRPDIIMFDDFDTDDKCRNTDLVDEDWEWITEAVMGCRSVSIPTLFLWNGNKIAEDCCIVRAIEYADHVDTVNIRDEDGKSTWAKNTEANIDRVLSLIPYSAQQKEYYNNPVTKGKSFTEMRWGKCPPLSKLLFAVSYADPATSNRDKARGKKGKNSNKAVFLVGKYQMNYYIYTGFVDHTNNSTFVSWLYAIKDYVRSRTQLYTYIENNTLQNPFYEQVLRPLIVSMGKLRDKILGVIPDDRKKPEKFFRVEGALQPLNDNGQLIFNIAEKDNPHMKRLEAQFLSVSPHSKTMDGPDCIEGAVYILDHKTENFQKDIKVYKRRKNQKRF